MIKPTYFTDVSSSFKRVDYELRFIIKKNLLFIGTIKKRKTWKNSYPKFLGLFFSKDKDIPSFIFYFTCTIITPSLDMISSSRIQSAKGSYVIWTRDKYESREWQVGIDIYYR